MNKEIESIKDLRKSFEAPRNVNVLQYIHGAIIAEKNLFFAPAGVFFNLENLPFPVSFFENPLNLPEKEERNCRSCLSPRP